MLWQAQQVMVEYNNNNISLKTTDFVLKFTFIWGQN